MLVAMSRELFELFWSDKFLATQMCLLCLALLGTVVIKYDKNAILIL